MDREEALRLLRGGAEGIAEWNHRCKAGDDIPNLSECSLVGVDLSDANLRNALLMFADVRGSNLSRANLIDADLSHADLGGANLSDADLGGANLGSADLACANFSDVDLRGANLNSAGLRATNLTGADLREADLTEAVCTFTVFADVDLSTTNGLDSVNHKGRSTIGYDTLFRSEGHIPEAFLRGCSLTQWEILAANLYRPELTPSGVSDLQYRIFDAWTNGRSMINGCFISYSHEDAKFVDKLRERLITEGVNVWLDRHDMVAGTVQDQVWRAIQLHDVALLVLSEASVASDWVANELDIARNKEKSEGRAVLCPVSLDDAWKAKIEANYGPGDPCRQLWRTLQQKLVVDFSQWKTKAFAASFAKLVRGLKANYVPR